MRVIHLIAFAGLTTALGGPAQAQGSQPPAATAPAASPSLYMIRLRPGPSYRPNVPLLQQDLREHGRYMQELVTRGVILVAGPTMTESGGLVLLRAGNIEEARALMLADPAIRSGLFVGEVSDWRPFFDPGNRFRAAPSQP